MLRSLRYADPGLVVGQRVFWRAGYDDNHRDEYALFECEIVRECLPGPGELAVKKKWYPLLARKGHNEDCLRKDRTSYFLKVSRLVCGYPKQKCERLVGKIIKLNWCELSVCDGIFDIGDEIRRGAVMVESESELKRLAGKEGLFINWSSRIVRGESVVLRMTERSVMISAEVENRDIGCACCRTFHTLTMSYKMDKSDISIVLGSNNHIVWLDATRYDFPGLAGVWSEAPKSTFFTVMRQKTLADMLESHFATSINS